MAATTGWSASTVCSRVATSVRTSMRSRWYCGAGVGGFERFTSLHRWNQTRVRLSARRESGAARTQRDLTETACRNAKTSSQLSAMVVNVSAAAVSAEACFALPGFFVSAAVVSAEASFALPGFSLLRLQLSGRYCRHWTRCPHLRVPRLMPTP